MTARDRREHFCSDINKADFVNNIQFFNKNKSIIDHFQMLPSYIPIIAIFFIFRIVMHSLFRDGQQG